MKNIVTFILLFIVTFSSCYSQTVRIKNLPSTNDSLKSNDYLVTDEITSGEVKKLTVEAIRKGLPAATTNAKGLFSAADKKIISKILYNVSGSDTTLTAWGDWKFKGDNAFYGINNFYGFMAIHSPGYISLIDGGTFFLAKKTFINFDQELAFDATGEYLRWRTGLGGESYRIDTAASRRWVRQQNFGTGGISDVVLELKGSIDPMEHNQLGWYYLDTNGVRYPYLVGNFNYQYIYTGRDTIPTLAYLKNVMGAYLNPYHFKKFGSPDSVEILDSLFKGTAHGSNLSGVNSEVLYYNTNSVRLNPTSNKQYLSASFVSEKLYAHQVIIYNTSSSYTVTFTPGIAFKLKNNSDVVLGYNDTIVLDYDGYIWRQIGGSDN